MIWCLYNCEFHYIYSTQLYNLTTFFYYLPGIPTEHIHKGILFPQKSIAPESLLLLQIPNPRQLLKKIENKQCFMSSWLLLYYKAKDENFTILPVILLEYYRLVLTSAMTCRPI